MGRTKGKAKTPTPTEKKERNTKMKYKVYKLLANDRRVTVMDAPESSWAVACHNAENYAKETKSDVIVTGFFNGHETVVAFIDGKEVR